MSQSTTNIGSGKVKIIKKIKNKKPSDLLTQTATTSTSTTITTPTTTKSPKSLIKKLNISKVYQKGKKKLEIKTAQPIETTTTTSTTSMETDLTASRETLCSIEDETIINIREKQDDTQSNQEQSITHSELTENTEIAEIDIEEDLENKLIEKIDEEIVETPTKTILGELEDISKQEHDEDYLEDNPTEYMKNPPPSGNFEATGLKKECLYKILVIGELGTGKTSIIKRYVHQFFSQHYRATIGVDFALKVINWDQNTVIRLQLWDIAGQERFGNMTRVYYKEAVGAFIVFDVTRVATFEAVVKWKQDLDAKVQLADGSPIPCVLLANKCDQQKEGTVNNQTKMNEYCEEHKFTAWFETSAKENINIEEAAKTLVQQILSNDMTNDNGRSMNRDSSKFPLDGHLDGNSADQRRCNC